MSWFTKLGTLLSQSINALAFGGHPDMSLSTRAHIEQYDSRFWGFIRHAADAIFGPGHCAQSYCADYRFAKEILEWHQ